MARTMPSNPSELRLAGAPPAELETLELLAAGLPDDYTVFHAVHWAGMTPGHQRFGEIDFVVVNQAGDLLLIEQKNGRLLERENALIKEYGGSSGGKSVADQLHRGRDGLLTSLQDAGLVKPEVRVLIYCPDYRVVSVTAAGLSLHGVVDATERNALCERVQVLLRPGIDRGDGQPKAIRDFLAQALELVPDMDSTAELHERTFRRLHGGLHDLIDGLDFEPWRLRIDATAGAGKSLMAVHAFEQARARGERPLLVCFNRPLADRLQDRLAEPEDVDSFHGLCRQWLNRYGTGFEAERIRKDGASYWQEVVDQMADVADRAGPYDTLIVDEGQDFDPEWWEVLRLAMKPGFRCLWVEDTEQDLYGREPVPLDDFVIYHCRANFRTPARIARFIGRLLGSNVDWRNPLRGMNPIVHTYRDNEEQLALLEDRIEALMRIGFRPEQIAIVSVHGLHRALFAGRDVIGSHRLGRFSGEYTAQGQAIMIEGDIRAETLFRFKGQQAPAVLLTDIAFDGGDHERERRLLYCGITRATVACELLVQVDSSWAKQLSHCAR